MRVTFSVIFILLVCALIVCAILSFKSKKKIGTTVGFLLISLIPPVMGNLFIFASPYENLSLVGCYIYFLGMNLVVFSLAQFILKYCELPFSRTVVNIILGVILIADSVQLLLNLKFGHAFTMEQIDLDGGTYNRFIPLLGQSIHRIIDYGLLGLVFLIIFMKAIRTPRVYSEKYWVVFVLMVAITIWESYYIFSRTPLDRSMIGFGVFGLFVFYISLFYRPLRLLDRMLASIASRMPEVILFFDKSGKCIWANNQAKSLLEINSRQLDLVNDKLSALFGKYQKEGLEWTTDYSSGEDDNLVSYVLESHSVIDDKERVVGSVLTIRDNSIEQKALKKETFNATHDPLTNILNRAGYNAVIANIDLEKSMLVLIDLDSFKETNDTYGHEIGDKVLIHMVEVIQKYFRNDDYFCRIGGDEFAVVLPEVEDDVVNVVQEKIKKINEDLMSAENDLPKTTISAGGCFGRDVENTYELFKKADYALYQTKFTGKKGFTLYKRK